MIEKTSVDLGVEVFRQVGFPAIVAAWFMWRAEKKFDAIFAAIRRLRCYHPSED